MHESGAPFVLLGVRGILLVELTAKGGEWDNHSGNKGNIVPNPAWELIDLLKTMKDDDDNILIDGFHDDIRQLTQKDEALLSTLPFDKDNLAEQIGYEDFDMSREEYYRKLTLEPTLNIQGFMSAYSGKGTKTISPATATVKIDMRLVVDQDPEDIYEKFKLHVDKHAPNIEVTHRGQMLPSRTPSDLEIVDIIKQAVEKSYEQ